MTRWRVLAAALLSAAALTGVSQPAQATTSVAADGSILVTGLDLHDGMVANFDGTYYLYGTMYGCGFQWLITPTTFCGFGVSTAPALTGPWSAPTLLFSTSGIDPYTGWTWANLCVGGGAGCFNPRMIRRGDGVFILWFNSPYTWTHWGSANAYNVMGCNGPTGPCGAEAGPPNGTSNKPSLSICSANGDFAIHTSGADAWIVCTRPTMDLRQEKLNVWWSGGAGVGLYTLAGLTKVESPGVYYEPALGKWVLTFAIPNCGYCTSTGTAYATSSSPAGPWTVPTDLAASGAPGNGRQMISPDSCGGQPRTVSVVDAQPYELVDLWTGARNETTAGLYLVALHTQAPVGVAGDGGLFRGPFAQWSCEA